MWIANRYVLTGELFCPYAAHGETARGVDSHPCDVQQEFLGGGG
jgi:hypothetical protein